MAKLGALWDYLTSIVGKLTSLGESIIALPGRMIELISNFFKEVFIPDKEVLTSMFEDTKAHIESKFPFLSYSSKIISIFQGEAFIEDVEVGLSLPYVGSFGFKIIESKYVNQGIEVFRSFIRGWIILMVLFYHLNEFYSFIGHRYATVHSQEANDFKASQGRNS